MSYIEVVANRFSAQIFYGPKNTCKTRQDAEKQGKDLAEEMKQSPWIKEVSIKHFTGKKGEKPEDINQ